MKHLGLPIFLCALVSCSSPNTTTISLYVGTYTDGESEGIYRLPFDTTTGMLADAKLVAAAPNPSYLEFSKNNSLLYAVEETDNFDQTGGGVAVFEVQKDSLILVQEKPSGGAHPCHLAVEENQLGVANYTGGNVAIYTLDNRGYLTDRQMIQHYSKDSTQTPHAHKVVFQNGKLFVSDLGLDRVFIYAKGADGAWDAKAQRSISLPTGAGPRHFVFSKNAEYLYILNELNATLSVFQHDGEGNYNAIQTESTVDTEWKGEKSCAHIQFSSDYKFLYATNRGENTIVTYAVNLENGRLNLIQRTSVQGDWPRNFTIDPTGDFLLVANQRSHNIVVFSRDKSTGILQQISESSLHSPVCLLFEN